MTLEPLKASKRQIIERYARSKDGKGLTMVSTANIVYHHVHHLSARIPSYCLAACHEEFAHLFVGVRRIGLGQVPAALRCILWDEPGARIVAVPQRPR